MLTIEFLKKPQNHCQTLCVIFSTIPCLNVYVPIYGKGQTSLLFSRKVIPLLLVIKDQYLSLKYDWQGNGKIIHKYMFNFIFNDNQVITCLKSGFVPGESTVNQLVVINNTFFKALDEGKDVIAGFLHNYKQSL